MAGYIGNTQKISGSYTVDEFTSSGGTTYTLTKTPGAKNNIQESAGGLTQYPSAYSVSGTTLTLSGVPSGQKVVVRHMGDTIPYPLLADDAVTSAKIANDAVTGAKLNPALVAGDVIYADGTDTINRLAKGTAAQVLTMNAGATAPEWAAASSTGNFKWLACLSSDNANKLGDGATWNTSDGTNSWTEIYDEGSGFSAGTWTAPAGAGGKYIICANIFMAGITTSHDQIKISIKTSNRTYLPVLQSDPGDYFNTADGSLSHTCAVIADVDAGDTVYVRIWVSGGSTVIDLKGNGTTETSATFFSGALLA